MTQNSITFYGNSVKLARTFITENFSLITISLLTFFVLSSKHIIIYNEETLVLICFISFLIFTSLQASDSIEKSLNERSNAIYSELQNSFSLKESLFLELLQEQKKELLLQNFIAVLMNGTRMELQNSVNQRRKALQNILISTLFSKLSVLLQFQINIQEKIQKAILQGFRGNVLERFELSKKELRIKLIQQAIISLREMK
jgi:Ca2+/Na+ antiporter